MITEAGGVVMVMCAEQYICSELHHKKICVPWRNETDNSHGDSFKHLHFSAVHSVD